MLSIAVQLLIVHLLRQTLRHLLDVQRQFWLDSTKAAVHSAISRSCCCALDIDGRQLVPAAQTTESDAANLGKLLQCAGQSLKGAFVLAERLFEFAQSALELFPRD